jgi:hypothetical protein
MEEEGGRRKEYSDADASGAPAPPAASLFPEPPKPIDLKAAVFASGVPLLTSTGITDRAARSMLGRWRQIYRDGAVLDALSAAQAESPSDPVAWITKALEARNGNRTHVERLGGPGADPLLADYRAALAEEAAERESQEDYPGTRIALPARVANSG